MLADKWNLKFLMCEWIGQKYLWMNTNQNTLDIKQTKNKLENILIPLKSKKINHIEFIPGQLWQMVPYALSLQIVFNRLVCCGLDLG